jgi:hypothetical protein
MLIEATGGHHVVDGIFEVRDVFTFVLALAGLLLLVTNQRLMRGAPHAWFLVAAFLSVTFGLGASVVEDVAAPAALNTLEHCAYAAGAVLLAAWTWRVPSGERAS